MKVLVIFGTRPEGVKLAPVIKKLQSDPTIETHICITAQHRQMLDQVLDVFQIQPDLDLNLMQHDQSLTDLTVNLFKGLSPVVKDLSPDWILVQGDTTTVMVASLLAYYHRVKIGHVEAGLRTWDKWQPFPEEVNRQIAGAVADLHFAPTEKSQQNLLKENVSEDKIIVTGNPVIDALNAISKLETPAEITNLLKQLKVYPQKEKQLILVTAHRRENFGQPIENICRALRRIAEAYANRLELVYPVHLNPNIQQPVKRLLGEINNITLLEPLDYLPMISLMKHARIVLTDSGGIQEEATALGIPTLVFREVTERPEGVEAGVLKLVGTDQDRIFKETSELLEDKEAYQRMAVAKNPFGDGHTAEKIVNALLAYTQNQ